MSTAPHRIHARRALSGALAVGACGPALAAQNAPGPGLESGQILHLVLVFVGILVAIGVLAWLARQLLRLQPGAPGLVRVLGGVSIGARDRVVVLQVGDAQLVVGVSPGRLQTLHVLDRPLAPPADEPASAGFASQLARALGRGHTNGGRRV
jgi:flagellar protein FliO/FliZ